MSRKKSNINEKNLKKIGSRIRLIRKKHSLNQAKFSKSIGISSNYLSNLETGRFKPSMPILLAIKNQYSIIPESILTGQGFPITEKNGFPKVAEPKPEYDPHGGYKASQELQKSEDFKLAWKALEIISSKTIYSEALTSNINAFYQAMKDAENLEGIKKRTGRNPTKENIEKKVM